MRKTYTISWDDRSLTLGEHTRIMGTLNVTPDSFSDGGKFFTTDHAVAHGEKLVADGADLLDIGGESTRPFSESVPVEEEIRRVVPVIEKLATRIPVPISIDTTKAEVARRAIDAGAAMVNDVGALRLDPDMVDLVAATGVPVIIMHMFGTPRTMQVSPEYADLIGDIRGFLETVVEKAVRNGVMKSKIIVDPGIGFGKTMAHNLQLLQQLQAFESLDAPILIGPSRKAFIRTLLGQGQGAEVTPDLPQVEIGTHAAVAAAVLNGAHMVRVHDVAGARATVKIIDAVQNAG